MRTSANLPRGPLSAFRAALRGQPGVERCLPAVRPTARTLGIAEDARGGTQIPCEGAWRGERGEGKWRRGGARGAGEALSGTTTTCVYSLYMRAQSRKVNEENSIGSRKKRGFNQGRTRRRQAREQTRARGRKRKREKTDGARAPVPLSFALPLAARAQAAGARYALSAWRRCPSPPPPPPWEGGSTT